MAIFFLLAFYWIALAACAIWIVLSRQPRELRQQIMYRELDPKTLKYQSERTCNFVFKILCGKLRTDERRMLVLG